MAPSSLKDLFGLDGRVAVVTGASGVLGGAIARGLAAAGAQVGLLARRREPLEELAESLGESAIVLEADVLDAAQLERARATVLDRFGRIDVLVNAAGGNVPAATVGERSFFELAGVGARRGRAGSTSTARCCRARSSAPRSSERIDRERLVAGGAPRAHARRRLRSREGGRREPDALARRRAGAARRAGERHRAGLLRRRAEPRAPARRVGSVDRARRADRRGDAGRALRRAATSSRAP